MKHTKHIFLSLAIVMAACLIAYSCCAKNTIVKIQDLPQAAQAFLAAHFTGTDVALAIKDGNEYEIRMDNGWELEFDNKGQWEKIDCQRDAIPASVASTLPEAIVSYLSSNFENAFVTEISKDRSGYDIELSNGLDLEFTSKGRFKRIDD